MHKDRSSVAYREGSERAPSARIWSFSLARDLTESELVCELGITNQEVETWRLDGLAYRIAGGEIIYDTLDVINWISETVRDRSRLFREESQDLMSIYEDIRHRSEMFDDTVLRGHTRNWRRHEVVLSMTIPTDREARGGLCRIWTPFPLEGLSQDAIELLEVQPPCKSLAISQGHGIIYSEVELDSESNEMTLRRRMRLRSFEVFFQVEVQRLQPYDKTTPEYRRYTSDGPQLLVDGHMRDLAARIGGRERNPYRLARKLYDHVLEVYRYRRGHPHRISNQTEAVLRSGGGDCAGLSLLFVSMCRSVGIPARLTGGLFIPEQRPALHAWAEFHLEGYGWVPVDISLAWLFADRGADLSWVRDYYFGHLDCYRVVLFKGLSPSLLPAKDTESFWAFQTCAAERKGANLLSTLLPQSVAIVVQHLS